MTAPGSATSTSVARTDTPTSCELCGRERELTFHHLIPRKVHRRTFFRRRHSKEELQRGARLCGLCHRAVHRAYDELTLAREFSSLQALRASPVLQRHVRWARRQKQG